MTWNHRVTKETLRYEGHVETRYAIREVFYNKDGTEMGLTENIMAPQGETLEELRTELSRFMRALDEPLIDMDAEARQG